MANNWWDYANPFAWLGISDAIDPENGFYANLRKDAAPAISTAIASPAMALAEIGAQGYEPVVDPNAKPQGKTYSDVLNSQNTYQPKPGDGMASGWEALQNEALNAQRNQLAAQLAMQQELAGRKSQWANAEFQRAQNNWTHGNPFQLAANNQAGATTANTLGTTIADMNRSAALRGIRQDSGIAAGLEGQARMGAQQNLSNALNAIEQDRAQRYIGQEYQQDQAQQQWNQMRNNALDANDLATFNQRIGLANQIQQQARQVPMDWQRLQAGQMDLDLAKQMNPLQVQQARQQADMGALDLGYAQFVDPLRRNEATRQDWYGQQDFDIAQTPEMRDAYKQQSILGARSGVMNTAANMAQNAPGMAEIREAKSGMQSVFPALMGAYGSGMLGGVQQSQAPAPAASSPQYLGTGFGQRNIGQSAFSPQNQLDTGWGAYQTAMPKQYQPWGMKRMSLF